MQEYVSSVKALLKVANGRSLDKAIGTKDSPLSRQVTYGVLRHFYYLSGCLEQLLDKPLADKHQDIELLLMAGIYSIDNLNRPAHASVNFAVDAASGLKKVWAKKLVNGVLRNYQRKRDDIQKALASDDEVQTNHPDWLRELILDSYPNEHISIMQANQNEPPMTLRVNRQIQDREAYLHMLQNAGLKGSPGSLSKTSIYLEKPIGVDKLPGFSEGSVSVQDEASQLVPTLLNLEAGCRILDACAAPGGKTCAILESEPGADVTAIDSDEHRIKRINENLNRLNLQANVIADRLQDHQPSQLYQRILLDVPCSAVGIIRRHPDIKLLRMESDIAKLAATQEELLAKAWSLLEANGELLYSTCSIIPSENRQVIANFLANQPDAALLPIELPLGNQNAITTREGLQLLPTDRGADGFSFPVCRKSQHEDHYPRGRRSRQ